MQKKSKESLIVVVMLAISLAVQTVSAQLTLTGTNYLQNFDTLTASGLPTGWSVHEGGVSATSLGNTAPFTNGAVSWSSSAGEFENVASTISNGGTNFTGTEAAATQSAALNRALGVRNTAAFGDNVGTGSAFVLQLANTTNLTSFSLSLDFLLLSPQGRSNLWNVEYGFGDTPTSFTAVGTPYLAQATTGGGVFGATHKTYSFGGALDNQPGSVWIRVVCDTVINSGLYSGGSGSRPTVGIDNFSLSYTSGGTITNPVVITSQPASTTNGANGTAVFSVTATGTGPISNQWYQVQNGTTNTLADGPSPNGDGSVIFGSQSTTLTITNVLGGESGRYFASLSNAANATNSAQATLAVIDPIITTQPQNRTNVAGDLDEFDAAAIGTQPMELTWYYGSTVIYDNLTNVNAGQTASATIFVTNSTATTNFGYFLVASNSFGSVTSSIAYAFLPKTPSTLITRWDFDTFGNSVSAPTPAIGSGVGAQVGGPTITNYSFTPGTLADPVTVGNLAWQLENYPPQGSSNKMVGFQFDVSTLGYQNILLTWNERHSATAPKYNRLQYTIDGTNFIDGDVLSQSEVAYVYHSSDLSSISGIDNNTNFAVRLVAEFESTAIGTTNASYVATSSGSSYGPGSSGGTVRIDLMTVWGNVYSAPTTATLNITNIGNAVVLSWANPTFLLQAAPKATGTFTNVPGAVSPYTNLLTSPASAQFFRLKSSN